MCATMCAKLQGAQSVFILPANITLIDPSDIKEILKHGKKPPVVVISPDRRQDGTNGLLVNPAGLIEYGYGPGSFRSHSERSVQAGARLEVIDLYNIALDLDLPEDMEILGGLKALGLD